MSNEVYVFGAGASIAADLPIQSQLLYTAFTLSSPEKEEISFLEEQNELISQFNEFNRSRKVLADFIIKNFCSKGQRDNYTKIFADQFKRIKDKDIAKFSLFENNDKKWEKIFDFIKEIDVSLENVFTILDKAIISKEFFKEYSDQELKLIQQSLKKCIIYSLSTGIDRSHPLYDSIGKYFVEKRIKTSNFSIISLNWDTLLDTYLYKVSKDYSDIKLDYCLYNYDLKGDVPCINLKAGGFKNIKILKLHGSMNWLICNNCGRLYTDYNSNIALSTLMQETGIIKCQYCESFGHQYRLISSIITPTFLKNIDSIHFKTIWHNAYLDLCDADKIVFIGYSFPEADFELRYILKKSIKRKAEIEVVLHESDNPDYYVKYIHQKGLNKKNKIIARLDLPVKRYQSFFKNHPIKFYFGGIEDYF